MEGEKEEEDGKGEGGGDEADHTRLSPISELLTTFSHFCQARGALITRGLKWFLLVFDFSSSKWSLSVVCFLPIRVGPNQVLPSLRLFVGGREGNEWFREIGE